MVKIKHIPIRTCVACRTPDAKRGLLRVVRLADGTVAFDAKGKASGRGAYVCAQLACIALARKQKKLERSLKVSGIPESLFQELELRIDEAAPTPDGLESAGPDREVRNATNPTHADNGGVEVCGAGPQESEE